MKIKTLSAALLCGAVMFSCSNEDSGKTPAEKGSPTEVTVRINGGAATRAETVTGTDKESAVKVLEFYVFDKDGKVDPEVGTSSQPGYRRVETTDLSDKIIVTSGEQKKFVVVVNMELGGLGTNGDYEELKKRLSSHVFRMTTTVQNSRDEKAGEFEMSGETIATIEPETKDQPVRIAVSRLVSRVDAPKYKNGSSPTGVDLDATQIKDLWGENSGINPSDISFNPLGYAVVNGLSRSDAFFISNASGNPENMPWNNWSWTSKSYLTSSFDKDGFYTLNYSGQGSADWFLDGTEASNGHRVYVHENKPDKITVNNQTGYDPLNVYAVMLKGELVVAGKPTQTKTRYWRINLTLDDDYHIMRNSVYEVYVKNIVTIGHENPEEAEKEDEIIPGKGDASAEVTIDVKPWTLKKYETDV